MNLTASNTEKKSRYIPPATKIILGIISGGRCEFRGCNDYLFYHPVTLEDGNFSEHAHIYPFSENATRGEEVDEAPEDIHDVANLMLLCPTCHDLVDDKSNGYRVADLREMKAEHEERIYYVTSFAETDKTLALVIKGFVLDRPVDVSFSEIQQAVAPMYPADRRGFTIDLTQFGQDRNKDYFNQASTYIARRMQELYERSVDGASVKHISVFGIASIPLLTLVGRHLSDKVAVEFFHRHRDPEDPSKPARQPWSWRDGKPSLNLSTNKLQDGTTPQRVGILVSMSGQIQRTELPQEINGSATLYEIAVDGTAPSVRLLNTRKDLHHFWNTYAALIAKIGVEHPGCDELHLFLAAPPPVAMICGHERLPKVQPTLFLYDNIFNSSTKTRSFLLRLTTR